MNTAVNLDVNLGALPSLGDGLLLKLNALREQAPIFWSEQSRCWIITGHDEIVEGFSGS